MKKLKTKKIEYYEVDYRELEEFISGIYGQKYEIVPDLELSNDCVEAIEVEPEPLEVYDQNKLKEWKTNGKGTYMFSILMTDLCNQGLIAPGNYLVSVSW